MLDMDKINLPEILIRTKVMMREQGLSVYRYSKIVGISHVGLQNILSERSLPSYRTLNKLLAGLEVLEQANGKEKTA